MHGGEIRRFHGFVRSNAIFVPDGIDASPGVARTTCLGIVAHQDDLEFMAFSAIKGCFDSESEWFGGVVCTDGSGSSRSGVYAGMSGVELGRVREREQILAASVGRYSFVAQLGYASAAITRPAGGPLVDDLVEILEASSPEVVYTHNPADKHPSHIRVLVAVLAALERLPAVKRPRRLLGCEMWRSLDWMDDREKVLLDTGGFDSLSAALNGIFDSQIRGGKRYDLAVEGRRRANATLQESHAGDELDGATIAMDLTPLIGRPPSDLRAFARAHIEKFASAVDATLESAL